MAKNIAASRQKKPGGLSDKVSDIVLVVICAAVMLIVAYPLYYVLVASFSDPYDVYAGKTFLLPSQFTLKGYQAVFADSALFSGFLNSIKYTVIGTIYSVVMIYLVAYPLSVKDLPGRKYISLFFVITMYFGGGLVPTYLIVKQTGLLGSMWALFLPGVVAVGNVIIVRNFFENNIPRELLEAAEIDGASKWTVFVKMVIPLSRSIMAVNLHGWWRSGKQWLPGRRRESWRAFLRLRSAVQRHRSAVQTARLPAAPSVPNKPCRRCSSRSCCSAACGRQWCADHRKHSSDRPGS